MLFSTLTREDCIKLRCLDDGHSPNLRSRQMELLEQLLNKRGYTFYQNATFLFLRDLAPYESSYRMRNQSSYPKCLLQSYKIMFDAFDEFLKDKIGDHYELQGWDDPMGEIIWCEDHFDEEEALEAYHQAVADGEKYVYLRKVDKEGFDIEDIACNF